MVEEVMLAYASRPELLWISAFAFAIGYIEYIYSFRLVLRERSAPYPVWMHTFYLAHDLTGAIVFYLLAKEHNFFWFFTGASIALLVWNCFELFNLYKAITVERQEIWGRFYDRPVTVSQALARVVGQVVLMICIVNLFRVFMDDQVMFKWFAFTNILIAVAPGWLWNERRSRRGASVGLAIVIFIGTVNTFLPPGWGMWTTASSYFDQPWFYATGVVVSAYALRNVFLLLSYPAKPPDNGKAAIW
ncbi:hypothetical protein G7048_26455 (plasmid) [Diaphorobacter sp. HDW4B]|uniref:hypothetical protein n=1 Tax=Diaphorobacter sp. HDW4B TaxID=2714925 RepID=UPI00140BBD76|nr:hypothetical protein [Diaphorobacter sp. HDW4B]QIL74034.1 hypothetical protein G7048_26455 [Diaphorobacter sp. HDW4B]